MKIDLNTYKHDFFGGGSRGFGSDGPKIHEDHKERKYITLSIL